ncbi:hypothetical protein KBB60_01990 [Patescibacteria group bacterium]|nr:hypothetical protein [Patescibacteria group bacterium]
MIFSSHVIVGSAVGSLVESPILALFLGVLSHHLLDFIPHIDPGSFMKKADWRNKKFLTFLFFDLAIGVLAVYWLWRGSGYEPAIVWGAFGGALTDIVDNNPWASTLRRLPLFKQYHYIHNKVHHTVKKEAWLLGALTQVVLIVLSIIVVKKI